jgi:hypothetical protein
VGPRAGLGVVKKREIFCLFRELKPRSSGPWPVAISTELSWLRKRDDDIKMGLQQVGNEAVVGFMWLGIRTMMGFCGHGS